MPFVLALVASALLHAGALVGPNWALPGLDEPEPEVAPTIDAVLSKPAPRLAAVAPAPAPKPPRPQPAVQPALQPVASAPSTAPAVAPASATPAPVAVSPEPTFVPPAAPVPVAISLPGKGRVRYVITKGEGGFVVGQTTHTWEHDGFSYTLRSITETTGLAALFKPAKVLQESKGEVTVDGLRPREFRHERVNGLDTASLDWATQSLAYAGQKEALPMGTQDMLSMYYQLVLKKPRVSAEIPIATGRKLERYRFEVLGEEGFATPKGERRALHYRTKSGNDSIELWIATEGDGLPLKIRFIDRKGEIFDQVAEDIAPRDTQ